MVQTRQDTGSGPVLPLVTDRPPAEIAGQLRSWLRRHPRILNPLRRLMLDTAPYLPGMAKLMARMGGRCWGPSAAAYQRWVVEHDTPRPEALAAMAGAAQAMPDPPLISVVMPVYNTPEPFLRAAIHSVRAQAYPHWEMCIADDASPAPHVQAVLAEAAASDPRIRTVRRSRNGHISAASNSALELARGEFVALMDHDDLLPPQALFVVAQHIRAHPETDLFFSDEDKVDGRGRRYGPYFKPGWNPELLLGQNLVSHLGVYRRELLLRLGGLREGLEGSQDWDLALRTVAAAGVERVRHIPAILYHWRQGADAASFSEGALDRCAAAGRRAVVEHLEQGGVPGARVVAQGDLPGWSRVCHVMPQPQPMASLVLALPAAPAAPERFLSLLEMSGHASVELLLTWPGGAAPAVPDARLRLLPGPAGAARAALLNAAAAQARGEVLVLLEPGVAPAGEGWLRELVAQALRPEIGAVGAMLLGPERRIRHAGYVLDGVTPARSWPALGLALENDCGYAGHLRLPRDVSAVSGACLAVRRASFEAVGGLALLPRWSDLDLCLKLRAAGLRVLWTPFARLRQEDGEDWRVDSTAEAEALSWLRKRWGARLAEETFFSPLLPLAEGEPPILPRPRLAAGAG